MIQLDAAQTRSLQAIKLERDLRHLTRTLAQAFPEVPGRLGERYEALIAHGVQRGAALGLDHTVCVARYLACWFMLGAEFEAKPEFTWAKDILSPAGRPQGSKVFQLCRRTREELARRGAPSAMKPPAFDQAIAALDAALMPRGRLGSLLPPESVQLGDPCDIDALDLRLLEPAAGRLPHQYRHDQGQWLRLPAAIDRRPITLAATDSPRQPPPALPPRLNLLGHPPEREPAHLRLRTRAAHCCDAQVHPLVTLNGPGGLVQWRGPHAADVVLDLYADTTPPPPGDALSPVIAAEGSPQLSQLDLGACGMRESGTPLGEQRTQLAVYPAEQHLLVWRREPGPAMAWPEPAGGQAKAQPARCRIERDGLPMDVSRWQAGLEDLERQLAEGLARLATAWERESGVSRGQLHAEPAVMCGTAGLTWGWAESPRDLAALPVYRLAGAIELVLCQLNLRFAGDFAWLGSQSRLALHCAARETLSLQFERSDAATDLLAAIKPADVAFRHPFVLQLEALAMADQAAQLRVAGPVAGAVVGKAGLRQRKSGPGLQWFCELAIEPVSVALQLHDPLLGGQSLVRPLLPAMKLLDWSLG